MGMMKNTAQREEKHPSFREAVEEINWMYRMKMIDLAKKLEMKKNLMGLK